MATASQLAKQTHKHNTVEIVLKLSVIVFVDLFDKYVKIISLGKGNTLSALVKIYSSFQTIICRRICLMSLVNKMVNC